MISRRWIPNGWMVARFVALAICLYVLYHIVEFDSLLEFFRHVSPWVVLVAVALGIFHTFMTSLRWKMLNSDETKQFTTWDYFRYSMIGRTFNLFMLGSLGGDMVRSALVVRAAETNRGINLIAIVTDRVLGLASILFLGTFACLAAPNLPHRFTYLALLVTIIVVFGVAICAAASNGTIARLRKLLSHFGSAGGKGISLLNSWQQVLIFFRANPDRIAVAAAYCLPIHVSWFIINWVLVNALDMSVSFLAISCVSALVWVITAIPITFSGIGVRELSFVYLLSLQGVPHAAATTLSLYNFLVLVIISILGIPFLLLERRTKAGTTEQCELPMTTP